MVWVAIFFLAFITFAAFVIDLGAWYSRRSQLQRAADAASAAGAQQLQYYESDPGAPYRSVMNALRSNGMDPSTEPGLSVTVCPDSTGSYLGPDCGGTVVQGNEVSVTISDSEAPQFFSNLILSNPPVLTRASTSLLFKSPQPASPYNTWGDGTENPPIPATAPEERSGGLWAEIAGPCVAAEDGDLIMARYDGNNRRPDQQPVGDSGSRHYCSAAADANTPKVWPGDLPSYSGFTNGTPQSVLNADHGPKSVSCATCPTAILNPMFGNRGMSSDPNMHDMGYYYKVVVPAGTTSYRLYGLDMTVWPGIQPTTGREIIQHNPDGSTTSFPAPRFVGDAGFSCVNDAPYNPWCLSKETIQANRWNPSTGAGLYELVPDYDASVPDLWPSHPEYYDDSSSADQEFCNGESPRRTAGARGHCKHSFSKYDISIRRSDQNYFTSCRQLQTYNPVFSLKSGWVVLHDPGQCDFLVGSPTGPTTYYVRVAHLRLDYLDGFMGYPDSSTGNASNAYGIRVGTHESHVCSATSDASCPTITPEGYFAVHAKIPIPTTATTTSTTFPLVNVDANMNGKTFKMSLFDPGEGASSIEIIGPAGASGIPVAQQMDVYKVKIWNNGSLTRGALVYSGTQFDVSNNVSSAGISCVAGICSPADSTWWETPRSANSIHGTDKYNDRMLLIEVKMQGIPASTGTPQFFSIKYNTTGPATPTRPNANDSTTWKVEIVDSKVAIVK